ncbi:MAG: GNAT family N-acetyltransferase [Chloroflexota bacterium]
MPDIEIRAVEAQESLDILYLLGNYAFRASPPMPNRAEWETNARARKGALCYALFEDREAVVVMSCPMFTHNVRGKLFPMAGFAGVSSHPKARNKGYVRQTIRYTFEEFKEKGLAFSCLYPFRESFYERLGWVTFPQSRKAIFDPADLRPLRKRDLGGEVTMMLIGDGYDAYYDYMKAMLPGVHGMAVFAEPQKESAQSNRSWLALAKIDGLVAGLMLYSLKGEEIKEFTLQATRFYYQNTQARYLLLDWIARHTDQAGQAEIWLPAYERPNTWMADMHPKMETVFVDPMGRVIDVAGIGGIATGPGRFDVRVSDPDCPWNEGTWRLDGTGGTLEVSPTHHADCHLTIQGLSALVYGSNDPADFAFRGWGDPSPQMQGVMRRMFPLELPYLHEYF